MDRQTIDNLPLDRDLSSREGISIDHIARSRIAYLTMQNQSMIAQTQFADAKAGALLAFIGLVATREPGAIASLSLITFDVIILMSLHAAVLITCIIVLFPRYANRLQRDEMKGDEHFSWPALAAEGYEVEDYAEFMRDAQISQLVVSVARSNHALARILLRKFAWLRAAFYIALADIAFLAARAVLSAF